MIRLIGVDCAVRDWNTGIALGTLAEGFRLESVVQGSKTISIEEQLIDWLQVEHPVLIALDAPLGWPKSLGEALQHHTAGEPVKHSPDQLFSRMTDRFVRKQLGKKPLEVGASRIARTARATLALIERLRNRTGETLPLAWQPQNIGNVKMIEVYPAATLECHGFASGGLKGSQQVEKRRKIYGKLTHQWESRVDEEAAIRTGHMFDAVICLIAALDFLNEECYRPPDSELARKEGWIWVRE